MVAKMINELSRSELVDDIKLNSSGERLPLKVENFVRIVGFFPPILSQLHADSNHVAIVAWTDCKLVPTRRPVHERVNFGLSLCFCSLVKYSLSFLLSFSELVP